MIRPHQAKFSVVHKIVDSLIIVLALYISTDIYHVAFDAQYINTGIRAALIYLLFASANRVYGSWRISQIWPEIRSVTIAWTLTLVVMVTLAFLTKTSGTYSRVVIVGHALGVWVLLAGYRVLLRQALHYARRKGMNSRNLVIAGSGAAAQGMALAALESKWLGLDVVGFYDYSQPIGYAPLPQYPELQVLGSLDDMVQEVKLGGVDQVYLALPQYKTVELEFCVNALADTTATVYIVPDMLTFELMHARWYSMSGVSVVSVYESPFSGVDGWLKRAEDIILAALILLVIALPMLLIAVAIKLSSPGPVIFKQRRYGLNSHVVEVWKFRTMRVCEDGDIVPQAKPGDSRVTPLGAFLRRTSLDELPQFINVLQGTMSVVGPRPHAISHNEEYRKLVYGYMLRHKVKPGITGLAQVKGYRGETDTLDKMQNRVKCDLEYIRNWTLWLDIKIVMLTVIRGFNSKQAY
jgi:putative colanic acid biosynthesis UDP-glucose lipid carrier transferase